MGYAVLHLDKAKGADSGMSAHIERTIHPKNADSTRTHLNRELIQFPEGVTSRTQAIQHRLDTAGLKRKIGKNQVQAIRILLSGTHEDMVQIEKESWLDEWCQDNIDWLQKTYGTDNVVSVVLHMDESTPHLHATVIPIVETERKRKKKEEEVKRSYRKKAPSPRLCADDVMSRTKLKNYQNTYAAAMQKYGLQRGIDGSEAQHISTHEYYRSLMLQGKSLQEDVDELLKRKEQEEKELAKVKAEKKTVELKNTAAKTANVALKGLNSLLGSNKISKLETENERLQGEITNRDDQIKRLQSEAEKQKEWHAEDIRYTKLQLEKIINEKQRTIDKILRWFPLVGEYLRVESECLMHGFSEEQTDKLVHGQALKFRGYLQADKRSPRVWAESVTTQIIKMAKNKLQLTVEQSPIVQWIQQRLQFEKQERQEQEATRKRGFHL
ncbi:MAG: plasmid recombination protein [Prevotella sp.]|nr:plasmid recombination protein [Prevotella sp.]